MRNSKQVTVSITPQILDWVNDQIEKQRFANVSHAVRYAIAQLMNREQSGHTEA